MKENVPHNEPMCCEPQERDAEMECDSENNLNSETDDEDSFSQDESTVNESDELVPNEKELTNNEELPSDDEELPSDNEELVNEEWHTTFKEKP